MYLSQKGIIPPKEWLHNPNIQNNYGNTVNMYLACNNISIPDELLKNYTQTNKKFTIKFI